MHGTYFLSLSLVHIETWEIARRTENFNETVGVMTLLKLFEIEPLTKKVFDIDVKHTPTKKELEESGNLVHAVRMFEMFDVALNMLGPDVDVCTRIDIRRFIGVPLFAISYIQRSRYSLYHTDSK